MESQRLRGHTRAGAHAVGALGAGLSRAPRVEG